MGPSKPPISWWDKGWDSKNKQKWADNDDIKTSTPTPSYIKKHFPEHQGSREYKSKEMSCFQIEKRRAQTHEHTHIAIPLAVLHSWYKVSIHLPLNKASHVVHVVQSLRPGNSWGKHPHWLGVVHDKKLLRFFLVTCYWCLWMVTLETIMNCIVEQAEAWPSFGAFVSYIMFNRVYSTFDRSQNQQKLPLS